MIKANEPISVDASVSSDRVVRLIRPIAPQPQRSAGSGLIPSAVARTIPRTRLIEQICARKDAPPTCLLIAPIGCGKTNLMVELAEYSRQQGRAVSWITLSAHHGAPDPLLQLLERAFNCSDARPPLADLDVSTWACAASQYLLLAVSRCAPATFCIDRIEELKDPKSQALVERLIESWPRRHFLFCAGRSLRGIRIAKALLDGTTAEFGPDDLALDPLELADLAREFTAEDDSSGDAEPAVFLANGWIAGARALLATKKRPDRGAMVIPPVLGRYLEERVCGALTAEQASLVMDLAVLSAFSAALLADLPNQPCSWRAFESLRDEGIYFERLDQQGDGDLQGWYRVQPILADFLVLRLKRLDAARAPALHRFAAEWFESHGCPDEAVAHALQCSDTHFSTALLERAGALGVGLRQGVALFRSSNALAGLGNAQHPLIALGQVYVDVQEGRVREARTKFEALRASTASFQNWGESIPGPEAPRLADLLESIVEKYEDVPRGAEALRRLQKHVDADADPIVRGTHASLLALAYLGNGMFLEAQTVCNIALAAIRNLRARHVHFCLRAQQAHIAIALGRMQEAVLQVELAREFAVAAPGGWPEGIAIAEVIRGVMHYESNELDEADKLLSRALPRQPIFTAWFEIYALGFSARVAVVGAKRGFAGVLEALADLECLSRRCQIPRLADLAAVLRLREAINARQLGLAVELLRAAPLSLLIQAQEQSDNWSLRLRTPALIEGARLFACLDRPQEALDILNRIDKRHVYDGDVRERFAFLTLSCLIAFRLERWEEAFDNFRNAMDLALETRLTRRLLDHRSELMSVFDRALSTGQPLSSRTVRFCSTALRSANDEDGWISFERRLLAKSPPTRVNEFHLTPRETEILSFVTEGLSSKEIAYRLSVSESTVKTHRKKVYQKMGVSRRSQAIAKARTTGLP